MNQGEKEKTIMTALKKLLLMPVVVVACMFARVGPVDAVVVPGVTYPFTLTTVSIESGGTFKFDLSASGTFYVDCGDGGTLSGTGVSGGTITKSDTTNNTYTCTYTGTAGAKVVQFGGTATGYNMNASPIVAAISFYIGGNDTNSRKIDSISGNLSAVFPYISSENYPRFSNTFSSAALITSIPNTLFSSLTGSGSYMFAYTFYGCYGLTSIPYDLFYFGGNNVSGQQNMFSYTFNGCNSLTSIDGRLFSHITSSAQSLFNGVFGGCSGLTSVPYDLFYFGGNNVSGQNSLFSSAFYGCTSLTSIDNRLFSHVTSSAHYMFAYTFANCTGITSIPYDLFYFGGNDISGSGFNQMFQGTFQGCTSLTSIDNRLFSKIISPEGNLFSGTFYGCTGLTALPTTLFSHFTTVKGWMFKETFYGCTNLSGYIPPSLFSGLITNGHPVDTDFMTDIFANTGLPTTCPSGTAPLTTGYEAFWSGKIACASPITYACGDGSGVAPSDMGAINGYQFKPAESTCTAPAGKTFSGWRVSGTSDIVDANVAFTWNYGTGKTLTAQYAPAYAVTYSCGDGVGTIQSTFAGAGAHFMPAANVCTAPSGKGFVGWAVSGTNDIVGAGTMFTWNYTENKTLTARWVNTPFTITTTNIETWEVFKFDLSAAGTFYVDCGKDGVLGSTDSTANAMITGGMIVKSDTKKYTYNCSYSVAGPKTIKFGGAATGYNMDTSPYVAAISFYIDWNSTNSRKIASISGDLSAVFPYISSSAYPRFYYTFAGCGTLTSIPNTLFSSLTGSGSYMFAYTFNGCDGLTSVPYDLFYFGGNNVAGAERMFLFTFYGCNHLTSIDGRLFKHVTTPASYLFSGTFCYCGGLTSLDSGLFSHFTSAANGMFNYAFAGDIGLTSIPYDLFYFGGNNIQGQQGLFAQTFQSCTGLTSIDGRLFSHITSSAPSLFNYTFSGCTGLTSIPYDLFYFGGNNVQGESSMFSGTFQNCTGLTSIDNRLFSHVTSSADSLFVQTFQNCTGLTALPTTLFSQFTDARSWMFQSTFKGCTNLSGYISPSLFSGLIANNHPTTTNFMTDIFVGTDLDTTCPTGTTQFTTGYESVWSGKVACGTTTVTYECGAGGGTAPAVMGASDGVQFTPAASTCTPPSGKTFFGWAVSGTNDVVNAGVPFTWNYNGNKTFTAQYVTAYNVTYSCGDVGGTIPSVIIGSGMSFTVAENTCNDTNAKAFKGWAISGTNTVVLPGDTFTWNYTGNKTLTAQWENTPFSVTTTSISSGGMFKFDLSASGTFYVDCGEGGTLGSADSTANAMISGKTITKSDTTKYTYVCTYTGTAGAKTIKFGGNATGYNMNASTITAAISLNSDYNNSRKITSIYGDLSAIFPYISSENYPRFHNTFANAILITSIPNTLFSSLTGTGQYMFNYTFSGCTGLTSIPYDLFYFGGNNVAGADYMFYGTFNGCRGLTGIDGRLFSHIISPANGLFAYTFQSCTELTSIPYNLFYFGGNNVAGQNSMFAGTFRECTGLTSIDNRLFSHVTAPAQYLFNYTFYGCTGLTSIPYDLFYFGGNDVSGQNNMFTGTFRECSGLTSIDNRLFSKITSSAGTMFASTFDGCTGLTALPTTLFSQFSTATPYMFEYTFRGCTNLSGYIPPTLFSGLITNNHPTQNDFMTDIFIDTGLATTCPSGTGQFITGYESVWSSKVACGDSVTYECGAGGGNAPAVTGAVNGFQFTPAASTCTPPNGKTFLGWAVSGTNDVVNAGDTFTWNYTGNKIFTAQYVNAYNVTYSCGDVSGTIPSVIIGSGMSFTVAENTCNTPNGKAFKGWAISGTNTIVDAGATFTWNYTESKTLTAQWENTPFSVTTTSISSGGTFKFDLSASGTFYVDCGEGGTLSGTGVNGKTITRSDTTKTTYTCTYTGTAGAKTIKFGGTATGYNMNTSTITAAISLYVSSEYNNSFKVASIYGDLSAIFPYISSDNYPRFYYSFYNTKITSIPNTLFSSLTGTGQYMFEFTFIYCNELTSIPYDLFYFGGNNVSGQYYMFYGTFYGCSKLGSIDGRLFSHVTVPDAWLFAYTFQGCTGLTSIPYDLFHFGGNNVSGQSGMFAGTFNGCTGLTSIDNRLFNHVTSSADNLFNYTFSGCTRLTSVPYDLFHFGGNDVSGQQNMFFGTFKGTGLTSIDNRLFSKVTSSANSLFEYTFQNCTGLTSIPNTLFSGLSSSASYMFFSTFEGCTGLLTLPTSLFSQFSTAQNQMFQNTFKGCTNLSGYIPPSLFSGLIANNSPTQSNFMTDIFADTGLATTCPTGTGQVITGYESVWSSKVACVESPVTYACGDGTGDAPSAMGAVNGLPFTPAANTCTPPSGRTFSGWAVSDTNDIILPGTTFTWNYSENKTLTAQYVTAYNVTYSCGAGSGSIPSTVTGAGLSFTPAENTCSAPNGKLFVGWAVSGTDDIVWPGTAFTWNYTENKTLTAQWVDTPFTLTTTSMSSWDYFYFNLSASGTFYVDCGEGGTLSSGDSTANAMISGNTITKSNTTNYTYTCTYRGSVGPKTLRFGGTATGYNTGITPAAISFYASGNSTGNAAKVASISGDLSAIFPYISSTNGEFPHFSNTFYGCSNLTSIPNTLFSGLTGSGSYMFYYTFYGCSGLTDIPYDLFYFDGNNVSGAEWMFQGTFGKCSGLTSIDGRLFSHITAPVNGMFSNTFQGCTGLTSIPYNLFYFGNNNVSGATNLFYYTFSGCTGLTELDGRLFSHITSSFGSLFQGTFSGCTGLTGIPYDLFYFGENNVSGQNGMFYSTFQGCTGLTSIDNRLFSHITSYAGSLFRETFKDCTGLTALPTSLFSQFATAQNQMFQNTFKGCTNLSGYIPPSLFSGLIANNHPTTTNFMTDIFTDTGLATTCPTGTGQVITGYESVWSSKVACGDQITYACGDGTGDAPSAMGAVNGFQFTPAANTCTPPSGRAFSGWAVSDTNDIILPGTTFTWNYTGNKTLTAQYVTAYNVTYACGDGTGTEPTTAIMTNGASFTPAFNTCTAPNGKGFIGWAISGTNEVVGPGIAFTWEYTENKTLTAQWVNMPFTLTTTSIANGGTFTFNISAAGTFYVDCGAGGVLGSTNSTAREMISGNTITKTDNTTNYSFTCTYSGNAGAKTIKFGGTATGYSTNETTATMHFHQNTQVAAVSGDLSAIFPQLGTENGQIPRFYYMFRKCTNLTSITGDLFRGYTGGASNMFYATFEETKISSIPPNLFSNITTGASQLFRGTFYRCTNLTTIPPNLFSNVGGTSTAASMFLSTFAYCTNLTAVPDSLFSQFTTAANQMFNGTFSGCTNLSGYIKPTLFYGLIANGSPTATNFMKDIFANTGLDTACPSDTGQFITGYESVWSSKVACSGDKIITYACGDGTGDAPAKMGAANGLPFTPAVNTCNAPAGKVFSAWAVSDTNDSVKEGVKIAWNYSGNRTLTAQWKNVPFTLTTVSIESGGTFNFNLSASGTFYVDCGEGGTLGSTNSTANAMISGNRIIKSNTTSYTYTCTYTGTAGPKTIQFAGTPTGYSTGNTVAAISFNAGSDNAAKVASISGDLSAVFQYISSTNGGYPRFYQTFYGCTELTEIPNTLFSSLTDGGTYMFDYTFSGCTGLTDIPYDLFFFGNNNVSGADWMFYCTFQGCTGLTEIDNRLFSHVTSPAQYLFGYTFQNCTGLTGIPYNLFYFGNNNVSGESSMFYSTFYGCTGLTSIDNRLFSHVTSSAGSLFHGTFRGCTGLTGIPYDLFYFGNNEVSGAAGLFNSTFYGCTGLTSIDNRLFSHVTSSANNLFNATFRDCTGLTSIPYNLFYFGNNEVSGATSLFANTFNGCTGLTGIDNRLFSYVTSSARGLFSSTFSGCTGLTGIPYDLFYFGDNEVSGQQSLFSSTFRGCTGLTEIDNRLFSHVTSSAASLFSGTFRECTGLTALPTTLFSHFTTAASQEFYNTFNGCTNLRGYIPPSLFAGLITNEQTITSNFMSNIFTDTDLDQSCSGNMAQFTTGYESQWSSKVACGYTVTYSCGDGAGTPASSAIVGVGIPFTPAASTCSIPSGHTAFEGWSVSGTDDVKPAGTAFVWDYNSNKTLTARYTPNTVNMTFDGTTSMTCSLGGTFVPPTPEPRPGYVFTGWKVVTCAEKISRLDTDIGGNAVGFQNDSNGVYGAESLNTSDYGITTDNTWATEFDYGTVWGKAICNSVGSSIGAVATINPENSGAQCWCQVTGFTKSGNNYTTGPQCTLPASNSWTFRTGFSGVDECAQNCVNACATFVQGRPVFRAAIFGAVAQ